MGKALYDANDIAADLSISLSEATELLKELCNRMERNGLYIIKGMVPKVYYEKQKEIGFLVSETESPAARIPMNEKRLLSIEEFCEYAGGIGECTARKYAKQIGAEVRIGGRCLVDRKKFDQWCDANSTTD